MKRLAVFIGGVAIGIGLAFLIGWVLFPIDRYDESPASMRMDYQDEYVRLTALAYQVDGDLALAERRLSALNGTSSTAPLIELITRWINEDRSHALISPLVRLARDFDADTPSMVPYLD